MPLALLVTLALLIWVPVSSADVVFGEPGSGAGQTGSTRGIAVNDSDGTVYVADFGNSRIDVFSADGAFLRAFGWGVADGSSALQVCTATCLPGISGGGAGQVRPNSIAVDNDPASPSFGDIYVTEELNNRVQRFHPSGEFVLAFGWGVADGTTKALQTCTATCFKGLSGAGAGQLEAKTAVDIGLGGVVHVVDVLSGANHRLQRFSHEGALLGAVSPLPPAGGLGNLLGFAVDSTGSFYVASGGGTGAVRKYDSSGALLATFNPSFNILGIAVDAVGDVYVTDAQDGYLLGGRPIFQYDSSGVLQRVFYGDAARRLSALAPYSGPGGDIFAISEHDSSIVHIPLPPPGPIVAPGGTEAKQIRNVRATLTAQVNPEGATTTYHFQYVDEAHFAEEGFSSPATVTTAESPSLGSDFDLHEASFEATGLIPETAYRFRAVASNADGVGAGAVASFETLPPLAVGDTWTTDVGIDTGTLHALVDPIGVPGSGYFEYVDAATFEASGFAEARQVPDVDGGQEPIDVGSGEGEASVSAQPYPLEPGTAYRFRFVGENVYGTVIGPVGSFTTFRPVAAGEGGCSNETLRTGAAAGLPDCRAYELVSPLDKGNGDIISPPTVTGFPADFNQASVGGGGLLFSSYRAFPSAEGAPYVSMYQAERSAAGWATEPISPPQGVTKGSTTVYDNWLLVSTENLSRAWFYRVGKPSLTPDAPEGFDNVYRRNSADRSFEPLNTVTPPHPARGFEPRLQGLTADGSEAVFAANDNLTSNARVNNVSQLYLASPGSPLRLVSVLPDGTASKADSAVAGTPPPTTSPIQAMRAGSSTHAFSEDGSRLYFNSGDTLYLRVNPNRDQSALAAGKCTEPDKACTVTVGTGELSFAAADGSRAIFSSSGSLYEYIAETGATKAIGGGFNLALGASRDATRVYFTSRLALAEGATSGRPNLYLHEAGGATTLVATLAQFDYGASTQENSFERTARVTADGRHLAFMSTASLTGYDNTDAENGEANAEVFLYEAGGKLICVSCNPTGGRGRGSAISEAFQKRYDWKQVAAFIPGWKSSFYASRVLSADGDRLVFTSVDALSPFDTNGFLDVYEWEAPGTGDCVESSRTYAAANDGCISLISSGEDGGDSEFVDADPAGEEIFFTTGESLVPQDPGLIDIYVAKTGGGFPPPPPPAVACEGTACQGPAAAPDDPVPASATFRGAGNVSERSPSRKRCGKRKVRRKNRCVAKRKRCGKRKVRRKNRCVSRGKNTHRRVRKHRSHGHRRVRNATAEARRNTR